MLSPRAVKAFIARPRVDWSLWKDLNEKEILAKRNELPVRPPIWKPLQLHQRVCVVIGARKRRFTYFNDTGTGKTFMCIALMAYFKKAGIAQRSLVLVPNILNKWEWLDEGFGKHAPHMKCVVLTGSSANKWKLIEENADADCFVETYAGFTRMICDKVIVKRKGKAAVPKLRPNKKRVKFVSKFFDGLYADESTFLANKTSLPYRIVNAISQQAAVYFNLTATPFGRDPEMLWAQLKLADRGEALGETLTLFRQAYYKSKPTHWGGFEYTLKPEGKALIRKHLDHSSITYPVNEADMPEVVRIPRHVSLGATADAYYDRAKQQIMAAHGNYREMENAFMRMRQISSGFVGYNDDETGEKAKFEFEDNPKLDLLETLLDELGPKDKGIIFHEFNFSARVISDMLNRKKIGHVSIWGKSNEDPRKLRDMWKTSPAKQYLVLSNSSGGYGLNLQIAKNGIFYESPVSAIMRKQTEKRFDRQFSAHDKIRIFDLIVRGTVDQTILDFHKEAGGLWRAIMNTGPKRLFGGRAA